MDYKEIALEAKRQLEESINTSQSLIELNDKLIKFAEEKENKARQLEQQNQNLNDDIVNQNTYINQLGEQKTKLLQSLIKMCEYHEKQATWDKGDNGYYAAKRLINQLKIEQ